MEPREETMSVGGVDVHVWKGGRGDPLLVLHGAGGNRGFTRWLRQVAERYTVWAPTHPGFGRSGDADWMETVDDLARFYLWFIEAADLGRPHLLGQSIGGWTAAEMAAMSPRAIDRLVLVSPAGLKPETGEILDVFYYPALQLRAMTVHDPKTIPEWEGSRPAADARRDGHRHAQPGNDRAPGMEALHAQSAARAFPAARDESGADRVGP